LRWEHVPLDGLPEARPALPPYMEVWRSVRVKGGDTKTRKSRRTLALPARCVDVLRRQRAQQAADRLASGEGWQETGLVFTTRIGTEMDSANVRRNLRRALACVPGIDLLRGLLASYGTRSSRSCRTPGYRSSRSRS
jgi:hypothetical protein